ncbi:serine/threonine protein kinase [Apiospora sp. TS-2023a]
MNQSILELRAMPQCTAFRTHISREERTGRQCKGEDAQFVSPNDLPRYWTIDRIEDFLRSSGNSDNSETVRGAYLQVLSILAWIQATLNIPSLHHLSELIAHNNNDASLPWPEAPRGFTDKASFHHFYKLQWRFCPIILNRWPIDKRQRRESSLEAFKIYVPDSDPNQQQPRHVVFKTYDDTATFDEELKAYHALSRKNNNIVRNYGSFYWISDTNIRHSTIILELAEEGSLRDLYRLNDPPTTRDAILKFWEGFIDLAEGLEALHNYEDHEGYSIIHQDLKPSNVLVFRKKHRAGSPFQFKIGDFGSSTVKWGSHSQRNSGPDTGAGKTYGPPELHLNHTVDYSVKPTVDTWALGCIMMEASYWLAFGEAGRQRFREERKCETSQDHKTLGCSDTFHDGLEVLQCVRDVPQRLERDGRRCDDITPRIAQYVLDACLIREKARSLSHQVVQHVKDILYAKPPTGDPHSSLRSAGRNSWTSLPSLNGHPHDPTTSTYIDPGSTSEANLSPPPHANAPDVFRSGTEAPPASQRLSPRSMHRHHNSENTSVPAISIPNDRTGPDHSNKTSPQLQPRIIEPPKGSSTSTNGQPMNGLRLNPPSTSARTRSPPLSTNGSSCPPASPNPPPQNPPRPPSLPAVTADEVLSWIEEGKKTGVSSTLPGWDSIQRTLGGRDYIIVIDNSTFMQNHRGEVGKLAKVLSYLMKHLDPNGVEVYFTSNPKQKFICETSTKVESQLSRCFSHGHNAHCQMEHTLDTVFKDVKSKLLRSGEGQSSSSRHIRDRLTGAKASGVSIYVLTSGVWDRSEEGNCGVEKPIESLIAFMKTHELGRTEASIQFVRFGADARGIKRLTVLDDKLPEKEANLHL